MSAKHLTIGSVDPAKIEGLLRIYSMKFCPFAQRPLLVLKAKNIPHEVVNINLTNKPEWYFKIHPQGKVPVLIDGSKTIAESLDICDYLEKKYPDPPLYPADPVEKANDKELIRKFSTAQNLFLKCIYSVLEGSTPEEWARLLLLEIRIFEKELETRGMPFFGGDKPGMADYMIWPWAERTEALTFKFGDDLPIKESDILVLSKWKTNMLSQPVCKELYISGERLWTFFESMLRNEDPRYDELESKL